MLTNVYIMTTRIDDELLMRYRALKKFHNVCFVIDRAEAYDPVPDVDVEYVDFQSLIHNGFCYASKVGKGKRVTCAVNQALYMAYRDNVEYAWFIEDDVLLEEPNLLNRLDVQESDADLICKNHIPLDDSTTWFYWCEALQLATSYDGLQPRHMHRSLQCVSRCSRRLLASMGNLALTHGRLFFFEYLANTLCAQNGFRVSCPRCMQTIFFDKLPDNITSLGMLHPVKGQARQRELRLDTARCKDIDLSCPRHTQHSISRMSNNQIVEDILRGMLRGFL